jgi:hypothetical protein
MGEDFDEYVEEGRSKYLADVAKPPTLENDIIFITGSA